MEVFGEPTIAVDTHVFRVANRTGLAPGKTPGEVEAQLMKITPPSICTARIIGSFCTGATPASRASRNARAA